VKKLYIIFLASCINSYAIEYINGKVVTPYALLTGRYVVKLDVDHSSYGSHDEQDVALAKKTYGIHNMQIVVKGYEPVDLIKKDFCYYPKLFTLMAHMLPLENQVLQRWARIKYFHPLSFSFKVEQDTLKVSSALYRWKSVAPFLTEEIISLSPAGDISMSSQNRPVKVIVNGKSVELLDEVVVLQ